jgi:hypothetical protein
MQGSRLPDIALCNAINCVSLNLPVNSSALFSQSTIRYSHESFQATLSDSLPFTESAGALA